MSNLPEAELMLASVTVRDEQGDLQTLRSLGTSKAERQILRGAVEKHWPLWVETVLGGDGAALFNEPVHPWGGLNRPVVSTRRLDALLDCLESAPDDRLPPRPLIERLLVLLPRLEEYGSVRLVAEAMDDDEQRRNLHVLPLVGFVPLLPQEGVLLPATEHPAPDTVEPAEPIQCVEVRLMLGLISNFVATVRFPDRTCPAPRPPSLDPLAGLQGNRTVLVRTRHLPRRKTEIDAADMATAIMRHLTSTCTAVVREIQDDLTKLERTVLGDEETGKPFEPSAPLRQIHRLGELADVMERDLARTLRRMPDEDDVHTPEGRTLIRRTRVRVNDALAELRTLQTELHLTGSTMTNLVAARQLRASHEQLGASIEQQRLLRKQLEAAEQERERDQQKQDDTEAFQRLLSRLGAIFLVPALIAALWGANTWLPGENQQIGFVALILLMCGAGLVTWQLIEAHWQRRSVETRIASWTIGLAGACFIAGAILLVVGDDSAGGAMR